MTKPNITLLTLTLPLIIEKGCNLHISSNFIMINFKNDARRRPYANVLATLVVKSNKFSWEPGKANNNPYQSYFIYDKCQSP